jgi:integrase
MANGYRLSPLKINSLREAGRFPDGAGLYLQVRSPTNRSWIFRYMMDGRARWMGLGDIGLGAGDGVKLAQARIMAADARKLIAAGIDPIDHRKQAVEARKQASAVKSFAEAADLFIQTNRAGWRNPKHAEQWYSTLATHVYPAFGKKRASLVDTSDVLAALTPIWTSTPETASRVRGRIERIIDFTKAQGWFLGENPARWKGHLANVLPKKTKIKKVVHHAALPWLEMPSFMQNLKTERGIGARAFEFLILTAARTGEVVAARWTEIDLEQRLWVIPAERMKAEREHRIPLSAAALSILHQMKPHQRDDGYVFPGGKKSGHLSNMAFLMLLRRMNRSDLTGHGFRSTFRDWCGDYAKCRREVAEAALAHVVRNKSEAAYARTDYLEERKSLMDAWANYIIAN